MAEFYEKRVINIIFTAIFSKSRLLVTITVFCEKQASM